MKRDFYSREIFQQMYQLSPNISCLSYNEESGTDMVTSSQIGRKY